MRRKVQVVLEVEFKDGYQPMGGSSLVDHCRTCIKISQDPHRRGFQDIFYSADKIVLKNLKETTLD